MEPLNSLGSPCPRRHPQECPGNCSSRGSGCVLQISAEDHGLCCGLACPRLRSVLGQDQTSRLMGLALPFSPSLVKLERSQTPASTLPEFLSQLSTCEPDLGKSCQLVCLKPMNLINIYCVPPVCQALCWAVFELTVLWGR